MKILLLPLLITLLPVIILFLIIKYPAKNKNFSLFATIILSVLLTAFSLLAAFYAMIISIEGMAENQIQFMTGAITFIPLGLLSAIAALFLLFTKRKKSLQLN